MEVQQTLELVQTQRNELRQEVKDLKAELTAAEQGMQVGVGVVGLVGPACPRMPLVTQKYQLGFQVFNSTQL